MTTWNKYNIFCITENLNKFTFGETAPTTCPTDTQHTVNLNSVYIVESRAPNIIKVQEETTPTGGFFKFDGFEMVAEANTTTEKVLSWEIPINVKSIQVFTPAACTGDFFQTFVNRYATFGILGANYTAYAAWLDQNYTVDQTVYYQGKNYKCILNTSSNQIPTNKTYWTVDYPVLSITSVHLNKLSKGFLFHLYNGITRTDFGIILEINLINGTIKTSGASSINYSAASLAQYSVQRCAKVPLFGPASIEMGQTIIGMSYVPTGTEIICCYENNSNETRRITIYYQYLY